MSIFIQYIQIHSIIDKKNYNHLESNKKKIKNIVSAKIQED